jgi:hypothetical protein
MNKYPLLPKRVFEQNANVAIILVIINIAKSFFVANDTQMCDLEHF